MLFNFMTNIGPNAQTYLLAGEVFPTRLRGTGAGFAAAVAKVGADHHGVSVSDPADGPRHPDAAADPGRHLAAGAVVTWAFRIETMGVNLEKIGY